MKLYKVELEAGVLLMAKDEESAIAISRAIVVQNPILLFVSECRPSLHPRAYEPEVRSSLTEPANLDYIPDTPLAEPPEF